MSGPKDEKEDVAQPPTEPVVTISVAQPASAEDDAEEAAADAFHDVSERITALDTRITEALEGERTWTTETIKPLQQELADLRSTLQEVANNLPSQMQSLRDELTRLSQELRRPPETVETMETVAVVVPPPAPPDPNSPPPAAGDGPPAPESPPGIKAKKATRVI